MRKLTRLVSHNVVRESLEPTAGKIDSNPTELASVVFGLFHYGCFTRSAKARFHRGKLGGVCAILARAGDFQAINSRADSRSLVLATFTVRSTMNVGRERT